jgi:exonuclease III
MATIKIATITINGTISPTRIAMVDALLSHQETDILLIQEVTYNVFNDFQGYTTQYNIGANRKDTYLHCREGWN